MANPVLFTWSANQRRKKMFRTPLNYRVCAAFRPCHRSSASKASEVKRIRFWEHRVNAAVDTRIVLLGQSGESQTSTRINTGD